MVELRKANDVDASASAVSDEADGDELHARRDAEGAVAHEHDADDEGDADGASDGGDDDDLDEDADDDPDDDADDDDADDEEPDGNDDLDDLEFGRAVGENAEPAASACTRCKAWIGDAYYEGDGSLLCPSCVEVLRYGEPGDRPALRAGRALGLGLVAATLSGLLWWGIRAATGYEIGLIAIVVGLAVGFAVRKGSRQMGGGFYQLVAVGLTYLAIVSTYVPELMEGLQQPMLEETEPVSGMPGPRTVEAQGDPPEVAQEGLPAPIAFVFACILALVAPFLMGFENIIGVAIIAFALWEAWKVNKKPVKKIAGPYHLGQPEIPG